ncbi:MAG: TatD family hydrolase [Candidatus Shapirobacteria bacterium]|jgi:TatD DNase family protein
MIDTHAHLAERFSTDRERIVADSKKAGVKAIILSASSMTDSLDNIKIAKDYPGFLYPSIGVHPQENEINMEKMEEWLLTQKNIVAVGECGLEFFGSHNPLLQEDIFRKQIDLSAKYGKPLIVHSREAMDKTIEILGEYPKAFGVIHCYTGGKKRIKRVLELGNWHMGIDGNLTYESGLVEVVKNIPKDRLVLETDSPFLSPVPHRGEECQPAYVKYVYEKVAEIWGISFEETEKTIDGNAKRLFDIV